MKAQKVTQRLSLLLILTIVLSLIYVNISGIALAQSPADAKPITVCVSMEKFTLGQGYIIEPILVQMQENTRASTVITDLLKAKYPNMSQPWRMTGSLEDAFYLSSVYDPDHGTPIIPSYILAKTPLDLSGGTEDWLGEFDYCTTSGWMYSVNGKFPNIGAADWQMKAGEVMRWQFTLYGYGSDLGADNSEWGAEDITNVGNKDALTWAIATCNAAYDKVLLTANDNYKKAMAVLKDMEASQDKVDTALAALKTNGPRFFDVPKGAWYQDAVDYVIKEQLFKGTSATTFSPEDTLTRSMVITVLYRLSGEPAVTSVETGFSDVNINDWYGAAAAWMTDKNLTAELCSDGMLKPEQTITREQLAGLFFRYAKLIDPQLTAPNKLSEFVDSAAVSPRYRDAVAWAVDKGILQGTEANALLPGKALTRSQFAAMLMRFC